ncbi:hypothetical protein GOHSU_22_00090 [Gordonia hirsuta DSM 44140 = NBRC 16056]|uniref:DUF2510 domain-containing protein n=1 Tax=Gordonia hirsuta DSM 44140 = NBRC 16056 TaxID=1121927 RepID=L7L9H0_9ACTN|nr:DUF2510 domain-containing protein [Gordonia hirsuta]GAC57549.1 hypothetical protein GOHSU_22_00090 [Gordonia hirsuta DSM 44140 = NBRC 16056]
MGTTDLRPDLAAAYGRLKSTSGGKKSLQALNRILQPTETVEVICLATPGEEVTKFEDFRLAQITYGVLVVTSSRFLFVQESKVAQEQFDAPLAAVDSVSMAGRLIHGTIKIAASGQSLRYQVGKKDGSVFVACLRNAVAAGLPAASAAGPVPQPARVAYPATQPEHRSAPPDPDQNRQSPHTPPSTPVQPAMAPPNPPQPPPVQPAMGPPPGWYQHPGNPNQRRWWDGYRWTEHIQ